MRCRAFFIWLLSLLSSVLIFPPCSASKSIDFYFYYPDSSQANLSQLKREMDVFLKQLDYPVRFQPFAQKIDFDRMVQNEHPALLLLPEWYYRLHGKSLGITALLTPLRQGRSFYTKLLLVSKTSQFLLTDFSAKTVAMTTMGPVTEQNLLMDLFDGKKINFVQNHIINTTKDADALFAVSLGHVDAAVVSTDTLKTVGNVSNRLLELVKPLLESNPVPMPLLCITDNMLTQQEIDHLKKTFLEQGANSPLPAIMEMLRIDGWQTVSQ